MQSPTIQLDKSCRPDLADIRAAAALIAGHVLNTPLLETRLPGFPAPVYLKLETHQPTGSFKLRGATHAVRALDAKARERGLVTASTGNHGRALAHAASEAGARAVVCMSNLVPQNKVDAVRALGAEVRIIGASQDDAQAEVQRLVAREGLTEIPPFDHPSIIAGQGTIGLEIAEALPSLTLVLVPLSGGGLAAGIAAAVKGLRPSAKIIGVSMERGAAMHASLGAGCPVLVEEQASLADSLGGGIRLDNRCTFAMCRDLLDGVLLLTEEEIATGIRHLGLAEHETVEGAGAVGVAALLAGKVTPDGPVATILSGRNIDPTLHTEILRGKYS